MKNLLRKYIGLVDRLNERLGGLLIWLTAVLVLLVCSDVALRYVLHYSSAFLSELEWHVFALLFLLGAGYTLKHEKHVRVDVFYANFSAKRKAWIDLLGTLCFLFPLCGMLIYSSSQFAIRSFVVGEGSIDPGGIPYFWLIKAMVPLGMLLLLLQGGVLVARSILVLSDENA